MNTDPEQVCHCGGPAAFSECCEPLLLNLRTAQSATQLMRSRYSAFATDAVDYLVRTHHPSQQSHDERAQLLAQSGTLQWLALQVSDSRDGNPGQQRGEVEFKAFYRTQGNLCCLHERSRFLHEHGKWFYVDAVFCRDQRLDIGRNDVCFCGSARKFKQCHGRG